MNLFYDEQGILGKAEPEYLRNSLEEIRSLTKAIKNQLGRRSYLLDIYLADLLEAINRTEAFDAADDGAQMLSELACLCNGILWGDPVNREHPLYERVNEYIADHPLPYLVQSTKTGLYCMALIDDWLAYAVPEFQKQREEIIRRKVDLVHLHEVYRQISGVLGGEEEMEKLNLLIRQRFQTATAMNSFTQGMTNALVYFLTDRDAETNKTVLQLWAEA